MFSYGSVALSWETRRTGCGGYRTTVDTGDASAITYPKVDCIWAFTQCFAAPRDFGRDVTSQIDKLTIALRVSKRKITAGE